VFYIWFSIWFSRVSYSRISVFSFSFYKTSTRILIFFYKLVGDYVEIFRWLVKMLNGVSLSVRSLASELARRPLDVAIFSN
jgi:hypothetical protein